MEDVLDPLYRRLLPQSELFSSAGWCGRFDCRGHMDFLVVVVTPVAAEAVSIPAWVGSA